MMCYYVTSSNERCGVIEAFGCFIVVSDLIPFPL